MIQIPPHMEKSRLQIIYVVLGASLVAQTVKNTCNVGGLGSAPQLGRYGEGHGNPIQYCLENPRNRGSWGATVHEIAESGTLSNQPSTRAVTVLLAPGRLFPQKILSS